MSERQIPERKDFASNEQLQISEYDGHVFVLLKPLDNMAPRRRLEV